MKSLSGNATGAFVSYQFAYGCQKTIGLCLARGWACAEKESGMREKLQKNGAKGKQRRVQNTTYVELKEHIVAIDPQGGR